jgi:hypothetical protein
MVRVRAGREEICPLPLGLLLWYTKNDIENYRKLQQENAMAKKKKSRPVGRPATGLGMLVAVRCQPDFLTKVDKWRAEQPGAMTRPQALRWLAEVGLKK